MLTTLLTGVILLFLGGIAYLAYHKPNIYKYIHLPLSVITLMIILGISIWNLAIGFVINELAEFIDFERFAEASLKAHSLDVPFYVVLLLSAFILYLIFLLFLSTMLKHEMDKKL